MPSAGGRPLGGLGGSAAEGPLGAAGRAPRLRADERIAPYITRRGRFLRINPAQPRALPTLARLLGVIGWAVLLVASFRRARSSSGER